MYIYTQINECDFHDAFLRMGRKENFSYEGRKALFEYISDLAESGEPIELDVIAMCCDYSEYASLDDYNKEYGTEYESWEEVNHDTLVIEHSNGAAIVEAH